MRRRCLLKSLVALPAVAAAPWARAQSSWPNRPIHLILQSPPGGSSDLIARLLERPLTASLGQPVVVESKPGSFGVIAALAVTKSTDGHTFGLFGSTLSTNVVTQKDLPYDAIKDFTPVVLVAKAPSMIAVNPASGYKTLADVIAAAKAQPGKMSYGSSGLGLAPHFVGEWLRHRAGIQMLHIPYKGAGPAINDTLGGQIPVVITVAGSLVPFVQSGKLTPIAVSGTERLPLLPNVPTIAEQGFPDFSIVDWFGIVGPANVPAEVTSRMNAEVNRALQDPAAAERLTSLGYQIGANTPAQFRAFIESEIKLYEVIVREAKVTF